MVIKETTAQNMILVLEQAFSLDGLDCALNVRIRYLLR